MPMFLAKLLQSYFRVQDSPDVAAALGDGNYEMVRRHLVNINVDTIFGPVSFNEYQRNIGRGAAGTQWIPASSVSSSSGGMENEDSGGGEATDEGRVFEQGCVSPLDQANTAIVIPSPSSSDCDAGSYVNGTSIESEPALLATKCATCPVDTFVSVPSSEMQCAACPEGSSTMDESGSTGCVRVEQNLIGGLEYSKCPRLFICGYWCLSCPGSNNSSTAPTRIIETIQWATSSWQSAGPCPWVTWSGSC